MSISGSSITMSAWVKPSSAAIGNILGFNTTYPGKNSFFVSLNTADDGVTNTAGSVYVNRGSPHGPGGYILSGATDAASVPQNAWTHLVVVVTPASNVIQIFVNGATQPVTYNLKQTPAAFSSANPFMAIGALANINAVSIFTNSFFSGSLDDIRVYNRALSTSEVQQLYQAGAAQIGASLSSDSLKSGLLGWWPFDGKTVNWTADLASDISGNANSGLLVNMPTTTSQTAGKIGQALTFNGANSSYILTPLTAAIGTGSYSYSVWFKTTTSQLAGMISRRGGSQQFSLNISNSTVDGAGNKVSIVDSDGSNIRTGASASSYIDGKWHNAVIVRDANTTATLGYIDGALAITTDSTSIPNQSGTDNIIVGASGNGGSSASFNFTGSLDDARVYNRALSSSEILRMYRDGR